MANNGKGSGQDPDGSSFKKGAIAVAAAFGLMVLFNSASQPPPARTSGIPYSELHQKAKEGAVKEALIRRDGTVVGTMEDGTRFQSAVPPGENAYERLRDYGGTITGEDPPEPPNAFANVLLSWVPMLLLIGVWIWFMKRQAGGGGNAFSFGKSRANRVDDTKYRFSDVVGIDEIRLELEELVQFLNDPAKFKRLGARSPKGVLMEGPPGTGKTLMAKAVAGEAGVPFFEISGADFVEMFVGVGASRVRSLFEDAEKQAPCIIFIDEIDAIGKKRGQSMSGGNDEREQALNQLLVKMDGFSTDKGIIVIAATNRKDVLDPALLRKGRFDRHVTVRLPNVEGRQKILELHARKVPLDKGVDFSKIARGTPGLAGADLENLVNEAALYAVRRNAKYVTALDFERAVEKAYIGEKSNLKMTEADIRLTAFHEAGHGVAMYFQPLADPLHKMSIEPRGMALGLTWALPENDKVSMSKAKFKTEMAMLYAGRAAEIRTFGPEAVTSGAMNDIERATKIARHMVMDVGMSDKLGPRKYSMDEQRAMFGGSSDLSPELAKLIDDEINALIREADDKANALLNENADVFDRFARGLLEFLTIDRQEIEWLVEGEDGFEKIRDSRENARQREIAEPANNNNKPQPPAAHQGGPR